MYYGSWFGQTNFKGHFGVNWANVNMDRVQKANMGQGIEYGQGIES